MDKLSYASDSSTSAWNTYLQQIERVAPYLGELSHWVDTLRHPKRALIVDIRCKWMTVHPPFRRIPRAAQPLPRPR